MADRAETAAYRVCAVCRTAHFAHALRCWSCGAPDLEPQAVDGGVEVFAVTRTEQATFAVVELTAGLRWLATAPGHVQIRIGDHVAVQALADGTLRLTELRGADA